MVSTNFKPCQVLYQTDIMQDMQGRTLILDCKDKIGDKVTIYGFVHVMRDHGKIALIFG